MGKKKILGYAQYSGFYMIWVEGNPFFSFRRSRGGRRVQGLRVAIVFKNKILRHVPLFRFRTIFA
ncbi:MAG: hypothetical protein D6681_16190 [Calditrichaeota bacterium]|nr:MAG: hypothetical protein D6681_16190 [Calditrichota bacterium]